MESREYCEADSLSEEGYYEVEELIGSDPKKIFTYERVVRIACWLWGKGAGKGTISSLLELYLVYVLECMQDPHRYFKVAREDKLDLMNVATTGTQSAKYFERFTGRLKNNKWFSDRYDIFESGRKVSSAVGESKGVIEIGTIVTEFPKNIRAQSLNARNESWEGDTVVFFLLDEASGFQSLAGAYNAEAFYDTRTTSTREIPYVGLITSFPRRDETTDFTYLKVKEAEETDHIVGSVYWTWKMKPRRFYCGKTFRFVVDSKKAEAGEPDAVVDVPTEYQEEATTAPEVFKLRYMCMVSGVGVGQFIERPEILPYLVKDYPPFAEFRDEIINVEGTLFVKKVLVRAEKLPYPVVIAVDEGLTGSDTALGVAHKEYIEGGRIKVIVDLFLVWRPDKKKSITVDINNVQEVIENDLSLYCPDISMVRLDHWNSASIAQALLKKHIQSELKNASYASYNQFRMLAYGGLIELPAQPESEMGLQQMRALGPRGDRKPRVLYGKQDVADVLAQLSDMLAGAGGVSPASLLGTGANFERGGGLSRTAAPATSGVSNFSDVEKLFGLRKGGEKIPEPRGKRVLGVGRTVSSGPNVTDIRRRITKA